MKRNLKKNYFLLFIVFLLTFLFTLYINSIIRDYNYIKVGISPLENTISKINLNELDITLSELNNGVIYIGNVHNKENKKLEKDILKKIKSNDLENYVYYCDISEELENSKYVNTLTRKFPNIKGDFKLSPALIYFKNGYAVEVIDSYERKITSEDLIYLTEKYQIGK